MRTYTLLILILGVCSMTCIGGPRPKIEYIPKRQPERLVKPTELSELAVSVGGMLNITNASFGEEEIVGWALKRGDWDYPPVLIEEVFFLFKAKCGRSNWWITAYVERTAGRGSPGTDTWRKGLTAQEVRWFWYTDQKPSMASLSGFLKLSNFGVNECDPDIVPIFTAIYAPFKSLLATTAKGISGREKAKRFDTTTRMIWDPK